MSAPQISITFKTLAETAERRGATGIVALLMKYPIVTESTDEVITDTNENTNEDTNIEEIGTISHEGTNETQIISLSSTSDIPDGLTDTQISYIEKAFVGGENPPTGVYLCLTDNISDGLDALTNTEFNYLCVDPSATTDELTTVVEFVKNMRDVVRKKIKAVLPMMPADHEGIINFTSDEIKTADGTFGTEEFCSRIAGLICGTPNTNSSTYVALPEVESIKTFSRAEIDEKVANGEFILFSDGRQVKVCRGVNSLTTLTEGKTTEDCKDIKFIDTIDLIATDINIVCEDNYIGKMPNTYDNKIILQNEIKSYLQTLESQNLLDSGSEVYIDIDAQKKWLNEDGTDTSAMSDLQIKKENTRTFVWLKATISVVRAIEDISMDIYI